MGKKINEKDGLKRENKQIEEGNSVKAKIDVLDVSTGNMNDASKSSNRDDDKNKIKEYSNEKKKDRIKKRKADFNIDKKECQKAHKKHKKSKDVFEAKDISMETCLGRKENTKQESSEAMNLENNGEAKRVRKDKHKKKKKDEIDAVATVTESVQKICSPEDINKMVHGEEKAYEKRKKKKQKLEKVNGNVVSDIVVMSSIADENGTGKENFAGNEIECRKLRDIGGNTEDGNGHNKNKSKSVKNDSEGGRHKGDTRTRSVDATNQVENATPKEKSKKVSFCDQVEVFPSTFTDDANKDGKEGLVYGKRYSKEEDEIVMNAVTDYIESHNLGEEGLNMVLNCGVHREVKNCWKEIQAAIPWRPLNSVYHRAHVLFERDEKHPWTPEELEIVQKFVEKHGRQWRLLADSLGKHRHHVKDTWRRIKLTNVNKGQWSQEEYQNLFDLVNLDLSMKATQERISKHGMLRDNICWTAISDKMQTRPFVSCCDKWYRKLTSPMVAEGIWADADDYRMVDALSSLDACCMEDVDWDNLIEHRSGDLCRKRWSQMVQHLGPNKDMSFAEQVDIIAKRYRPDMLDARETYDSKRPVDLP